MKNELAVYSPAFELDDLNELDNKNDLVKLKKINTHDDEIEQDDGDDLEELNFNL